MTRRSSWEPLEASDPTPGDTMQIRSLARRYADTRGEIDRQAANLGRLSDADGWDSDAGRGFSGKAGELHGEVDKVKGRYDGASEALYEWARQLEGIQSEADAAAADAQAAQASIDANQPVDRPDDAPKPTDAEKAATEARAGRLSAAQGDLSGARTRMDNAKGDYGREAQRCADRIAEACDDGLNDGFWDNVGEVVGNVIDGVKTWIKEHADFLKKLSDILGVVAAIVGVVGFILSFTPLAPLGAALQGIALGLTALKLVIDAGLLWVGEGSWVDVGMGLFAMATFGLGKGIGVLGRRAVKGATGAAQAANTTRAAAASRSVWNGQRALFGMVNKVSVAQRVSRLGTGNPIVRTLARPLTTRAGQYLDDVGRMADDAALASQGRIPQYVDGAFRMDGYPGVLNSLKYGGAESARNAVTVRGLISEFPEVTQMPQYLHRANQVAGATWATTIGMEGVNTVTGSHTKTVEDIGDFTRWTWNQVAN